MSLLIFDLLFVIGECSVEEIAQRTIETFLFPNLFAQNFNRIKKGMNIQGLRVIFTLHILETYVEVRLQELVNFEEFWDTSQS